MGESERAMEPVASTRDQDSAVPAGREGDSWDAGRPPLCWGLTAGLVLLVLAVYSPVLRHQFIAFDDPLFVVQDPVLHARSPVEALRLAFGTFHGANWVPLARLSHLLDARWFGMDAGGHHAVNLVFHCANTVLLFGALIAMTGAVWRSAVVAALFAVHPLHVESVAWVAERRDVLSTLFGLATILAYVGYTRRRTAARYSLVVTTFALGLLAKPMLVTLPAVLLLLDYWPLGRLGWGGADPTRGLRRCLVEKAPLAALSLVSGILTVISQTAAGAVKQGDAYAFAARLANAVTSYWAYLGKTVWPVDLSIFYPFPEAGYPLWQPLLSAIALAGAVALALRFRRECPYLAVGWLWYLVTLLPVIGLLQVGKQAMADRYAYVPLIGVYVAAVWGGAEAAARKGRRLWAGVAASVAVAVLAVAGRQQVGHWRDSVTLFGHAVALDPDNWLAQQNLGFALSATGRDREAIPRFETALRLRPDYLEARMNLVTALTRLGETEAALEQVEQILAAKPDYPEARNERGIALAMGGDLDGGIAEFREVLRTSPDDLAARNNLGIALAQLNRLDEAADVLQEAIRRQPFHADAHDNLANVRQAQGRTQEAAALRGEALRLRSGQSPTEERFRRTLALPAPGGMGAAGQ